MSQFFVNPDAVAPLDAITRSRILARLPKIQKQKRLAEKLREEQALLQGMAYKDRELGYVSQSVGSGGGRSRASFDPLGTYIPNTLGQTEKLVGAVGGFLGGRKADKEEDVYNEQRNTEILDSLGQYGDEDRPKNFSTDQQLRGYLGLMGEDAKDFGFTDPSKLRVHSTKTDENGKVWAIMSDNSKRDTGIVEKYGFKVEIDPNTGQVIQIPTSSVGGLREAPSEGSTAVPNPPPVEEGPTIDVPGSAATGAPAMGIEGMPPEAQKEMQTTIASMQALGMPQEVIDDYAGRAAAKAQATPGMQQQPTQVSSVEGMAPPVPAAGAPPPAPTPGPFRFSTAAEQAAAKKEAELQATNEAAEATARTKGLERVGEKTGEAVVAARQKVAQARDTADKIGAHVKAITESTVLDKLVGGSLPGRISSAGAVGDYMNKILLGGLRWEGKEGADTMAMISQLSDESFLAAYTEALEGTGQIATAEALGAAQAQLRRAQFQSPEAYKEALKEFANQFSKSWQRMQDLANQKLPGEEGYQAPTGPAAPAAPSLPAGWGVKVK